MPPGALVFIAVCVVAVPVIWMWRRMREERRTSADDYVAQAKARAQADLRAHLADDSANHR